MDLDHDKTRAQARTRGRRRPTPLRLSGVLGLLLFSRGVCLGQPSSGIRVEVSTAGVTGLDCRRRGFQMEYTKGMGRSYKQMAGMTFTRDPDPRHLGMGLGAMIVMAPLTVLAVPADLVAALFRRECVFEFRAQGKLVGWAGKGAGSSTLALEAKSLVSPGKEDVVEPVYEAARASTATDAQGRFDITVPARILRGRKLELGWLVNGLPSGTMTLRKGLGSFVLSEPEFEFGGPAEPMEPIVIRPK